MPMKNRPNFTFSREIWESSRVLKTDAKMSLFCSIIAFALDGVEPENLHPLAIPIWQGIRSKLQYDRKQWLNGIRGGRPRKNPNGNPNQNPEIASNPIIDADSSSMEETQIKTQIETQNGTAENPNQNPEIVSNASNDGNDMTIPETQTETQNITQEREGKEASLSSSPQTPYLLSLEEKEEKSKKKRVRKVPEKVAYAPTVLLYPQRYNALCEEFGKELVDRMILRVDAYQETNGKRYPNCAGAIRQFIYHQQDRLRNKNPVKEPLKDLRTPDYEASEQRLIARGLLKPKKKDNEQPK